MHYWATGLLALALAGPASGESGLEAWIEFRPDSDSVQVQPFARGVSESGGGRYELAVSMEGSGGSNTTRQSGGFEISTEATPLSSLRLGLGPNATITATLVVRGPEGETVEVTQTYGKGTNS